MEKEKLEEILNNMLSTGGDFAEVFLEDKKSKVFNYIDNKLDTITINTTKGMGLRLAKDNDKYYAATNDFSDSNINKIVDNLRRNLKSDRVISNVRLDTLKEYKKDISTHYSDIDIKNKLKELNEKIRNKDERISQVSLKVFNVIQDITICNHTGLYVTEKRIRSRIYIEVSFKEDEKRASVIFSKGKTTNFDLLDTIDYDKIIDDLINDGINKLNAKPCIGKEMPVIIGPGFGGVIFHEACGHAMEATSVANHLSVLSDDLNKKIASNKVTIIDDGTIVDEWGTTQIDDEGHETHKNILIEDGILKSYLIDELNNRKLNMNITGSGRRESYLFPPTSRMNNTYLAPGTDTLDDMIKSINLGLYAKKLGGGSVSTETGDFNFNCEVAYMIRDGKIAEPVKSASLIGNTKQILNNVEMVSNDLELGVGMCGSVSGWVPVTVGEPFIKVSSILVGGEKSEE